MGLSASRSAISAKDNAKVDDTHITSNGIHLFDVTVENSGTSTPGTLSSPAAISSTAMIICAIFVIILVMLCIHQLNYCLGCINPCPRHQPKPSGLLTCQKCACHFDQTQEGIIYPDRRCSTPISPSFLPEETPRYWTHMV